MNMRYSLLLGLLAPVIRPSPAAAEVISCSRAAERIQITQSSQLDPHCVYTGGFDIVASGVELDCQGARIEDVKGTTRLGIAVTSPATVPLSDITIMNCDVSGFMNNIRVTRTGFKELQEGHEYDAAYSNIVIRDSVLTSSRGSGLFLDAFVTQVTVEHLDISQSGSVGIYLEAGSRDNILSSNTLSLNGFGHVNAEGDLIYDGANADIYYVDTGREGIAVDGSRFNTITDNYLWGNAAGGIFVYKNCGEFYTTEPDAWWPRRYGSEGNHIDHNVVEDEEVGVWLGSRMAQNQIFMECSDPAYVSAPFLRVVEDAGHDNEVVENTFVDVTWGIRVEDDYNLIRGNTFSGLVSSGAAILVGTRFRTEEWGWPVTGTILTENEANLNGNNHPYRWMYGHELTTFSQNTSQGEVSSFVRGRQPPMDPFLFCEDFWFEPSAGTLPMISLR